MGSAWDGKPSGYKNVTYLDLRWKVATARILQGWTYRRIREVYGVSDGFIRTWSEVYSAYRTLKDAGHDVHIKNAMRSVSNRPKNVTCPVRDSIRDIVLVRRVMFPFEGAGRLGAALGLMVSPSTITKILREGGFLGRPLKRHSNLTYGRYERVLVNDLWHTDYKSWVCNGVTYHSTWIIDDRSRFILAYHIDTCTSSEIAIEMLSAAVSRFGAPRQLLTDHGTEYYVVKTNRSGRRKKSKLDVWCEENGIEHIYSRVRHPQTNGKMERTHRSALEETPYFGNLDTLQEAVKAFGRWIEYYNTERPNQALGYDVPVNVFMAGIGLDLRGYAES